MRIVFGLFVIILFFNLSSFGQTADVSKIEEAKSKLEKLQKELWKADFDQRREVKRLGQQSAQKGEFETTKQFEERTNKIQEQINKIEWQILRKQGVLREEIHKQMNEVFKTEFAGDITVTLGRYDADGQRFALSSIDGIEFGYLTVPLSDAQQLKENFSDAKVTGVLGLLLNSENNSQEYIQTAKVAFRGKTYQTVSNSLSENKAMQMVFGNYEPTGKTSVWKTYKRDEESEDEKYILSPVMASVLYFKPFKENNTDKYLLVANTEIHGDGEPNSSCHVCYGLPSVAVFSKKNGYWKVELAQKHAGEIGYYGSPGEPSLVKVGSDKFALKFSWDDQGMGYYKAGEYFWRIDSNFLKEILNIYTSEDNSEAMEALKDRITYRSTITFVPSNNSEFFDAKITSVGKKAEKVGRKYTLKPFTKIEVYTFTNGEYQLAKK